MIKRLVATASLGLALTLPISAVEPPNLNSAKWAVLQYANSGEYGRDVAAVALQANKYLAKRLAKKPKADEKRAIVFDIDETAITNLPTILANDFGYVPPVWKRWVQESRARAILPVQTVYELALRNDVKVFFITGRLESERAATERNLRDVGYDAWEKIFFLPDGGSQPMRLYKTAIRRQLQSEGYTIIANLGDQESDLQGGFAERTFKLPNPFYLVK